jgi:Cell division protein
MHIFKKHFFKENNQTWYRIRVGSYNDKSMAQKVAIAISNEQKEKAWVDHVRIEN